MNNDSTSATNVAATPASAAAVPLATTSSTTTTTKMPSRRKTVAASRRRPSYYNPVVSSMVRSNTLRDCAQVRDMLSTCGAGADYYDGYNDRGGSSSGADDSFVCRTALRYSDYCASENFHPRHQQS